jgi:uncharacterized membrane protein
MESASAYKSPRLLPLDALRGLIMMLMAIDHANYFVARMHPTGEFWGIPIPQYDNIAEFMTRFVSHICAPGFFFLMGAGMVLFAHSRRFLGWSENKIFGYLISRGIILIFLQFFLENSAWVLGPAYSLHPPGAGETVWIHFGVLAALGATMIIGSLLLRLKPVFLIGLSSIIVVGSQFIVPEAGRAGYLYSPVLRILYIPGRTGIFQVFYPIIPWLGIVVFGLFFGKWISGNKNSAYKGSFLLGGIFLAGFFILRTLAGFGNIHPPDGPGFISFFNITKYPPSLTFSLMTLGLCLIFIGIFSVSRSFLEWSGNPLLVFGRSALFFYVLHLYLFAIAGFFFASRGGTGLANMYLIWAGVLIILYFLCRQYGNFKRKKPIDSIWRFF